MLPSIKMSTSLKFLLIVLLINRASSLTCHMCTTLGTSDCLDKFTEPQSGDCEEGENKCVKYKTYAVMRDTGSMWSENTVVSAVTRGCIETDEKDSCRRTIIHGGYHDLCICSGDDCNAASAKSTHFFLLFYFTLTFLLQFLI
ncbi:uncharacterized protein LOC115214309 [Octopus sinensis]|uniref:Uncharacterized protein LOC115214309 n=1 Tax=Octopus sinensis TaxID=2607531 RepID=A0A6P7SN90_9MOLL|nr:uncharacterized protein LOC115214309 [Octopus sinensis]